MNKRQAGEHPIRDAMLERATRPCEDDLTLASRLLSSFQDWEQLERINDGLSNDQAFLEGFAALTRLLAGKLSLETAQWLWWSNGDLGGGVDEVVRSMVALTRAIGQEVIRRQAPLEQSAADLEARAAATNDPVVKAWLANQSTALREALQAAVAAVATEAK